MTQLPDDFKEFLQLFRSSQIEYLLVDGYVEVSIINLPHLKANKKASGRHKDVSDFSISRSALLQR